MKRILCFSPHLSTHADMRMLGHKTLHIKRLALRCPEHERLSSKLDRIAPFISPILRESLEEVRGPNSVQQHGMLSLPHRKINSL
jgi:hypothetical protein